MQRGFVRLRCSGLLRLVGLPLLALDERLRALFGAVFRLALLLELEGELFVLTVRDLSLLVSANKCSADRYRDGYPGRDTFSSSGVSIMRCSSNSKSVTFSSFAWKQTKTESCTAYTARCDPAGVTITSPAAIL